MPVEPTLAEAARSVEFALAAAGRGFVDREVLLQLVALSAVAGEHVLVIGPPGTAKSQAVRRVARAFGGRYFEYLLGRFTEPSEIFGPVDFAKLRQGVVETQTAGMLPEAEVAFLDEVFLGSTAILNTLLTLLNERVFRRGRTVLECPLRVCVGASNALPEDESLAAFADRFLLRVFVDPVGDTALEELLSVGWGSASEGPMAALADLDVLVRAARAADVGRVRSRLADAVRLLRKHGLTLTDRRTVKLQSLVAAAAALSGRSHPTEADLWPIVFALPTRPEQELGRTVLRDLLASSESSLLGQAALEASQGPIARAARLEQSAALLFAEKPEATDVATVEKWRLRLEGVAREIDASFVATSLPEGLSSVRARIVAEITAS